MRKHKLPTLLCVTEQDNVIAELKHIKDDLREGIMQKFELTNTNPRTIDVKMCGAAMDTKFWVSNVNYGL